MEMVIYYIFTYYSAFVMNFFILRNHLTRSAPKVMSVWLAVTVVFSLSLFLLTPLLSYDRMHFLLADLLYMFSMLFYMSKATRYGIQKQLFIFFMVFHFLNVQGMILFFAGMPFLALLSSTQNYLFNILVRIILTVLMIFMMHRFFEPFLGQIKSKDVKGLWAVPFLFLFVENMFFFIILYDGAEEMWQTISPWIYMIFISVATIAFVSYVLLIRTLAGIAKNTQMESEITVTNRQLEMQKKFYEGMQTNIAETKTARHDLRHHLSLVQSYIDKGETAKLKSYVNEYTNTLPADIEIIFCENFAVNSIIRYYTEIAKNEDIHIDVSLELPETTGISDADLCIVFGNCIENAIEACRRISGDKFIRIVSKFTGKMLAITVDNSFDGELNKDGEIFVSQKRGGEGLGISSVRAVARKYNEAARFEAKGNVFCASIMLRAQPGMPA